MTIRPFKHGASHFEFVGKRCLDAENGTDDQLVDSQAPRISREGVYLGGLIGSGVAHDDQFSRSNLLRCDWGMSGTHDLEVGKLGTDEIDEFPLPLWVKVQVDLVDQQQSPGCRGCLRSGNASVILRSRSPHQAATF